MNDMKCFGCYKKNVEGYCLSCRKKLFDGARVSHILPFDEPKAENLNIYQEKTKRLSISGVQLKYSLRLDGNNLLLTDKGGQYILKPIPPSAQITETRQAPENEHLTMQIADQVFGIKTAENALIYFSDGSPGYITRRFDVKPDGTKYLQEDMAQISGRSKQTYGENFKYDGTYEDIGRLISQYVAAYQPALEIYFRLLLYNYIFSNGDAHFKNFSLIQTDMSDYGLSPAYDLMSTVLHNPLESDTALDLYQGDAEGEFYCKHGYFGKPEFKILAGKLGLLPTRSDRILKLLLSEKDRVMEMIKESFLSDEVKVKYASAYTDKIRRMEI
ncbi:HipA domain-containing protein [Flavitalea flava]